jgi:hypothetical protein
MPCALRSSPPGLGLVAVVLALAACAGPRPLARSPARLALAEVREARPQEDPYGVTFERAFDEEFWEAMERSRRFWQPGQVLLQGFVGVGYPSSLRFEQEQGDPVEIDGDELDNLPVIGGGAQMKLAGESIDFGIEGMLSFSFRSDLEAFTAGGGGAVVVFDVDLLVIDVFGGPFLSKRIGDRVRVWAAAGPLVQFIEYTQTEDSTGDDDGSGYGGGVYTRGGIEFLLPSGSLVGFGVRYSSSDVDLGGDLGDFDLDGLQLLVTVSRSG